MLILRSLVMSFINKRQSIILFVLMSVTFVLVACQNNSSSNKEESPSKDKTVEEKEEEKVKTIEPEVVTIYVRENLQEPFEEIAKNFQESHEDIILDVKYLKNDEMIDETINNDKNAIVFTTEDIVNEMIDEKLIEHKDTGVGMMDELVLFTKADSPDIQKTSDIDEDTRIAILNPELYEEGELSKKVFEDDEFKDVSTTDNLILGDSVDDVKQDIANNNASVGVLYLSEVEADEDYHVLKRLPRNIVEPYIYKVGIIKKEELESSTRTVYSYLLSNDSLDVFSEYGYII